MERQSNEGSILLHAATSTAAAAQADRRSQVHTCCKMGCIQSKSALLLLLWSFPAFLIYNSLYNLKNYLQLTDSSSYKNTSIVIILLIVNLLLFIAPIAGLLSDMKFGHYKTTSLSSYILVIAVGLLPIYCVAFAIKKYFFTFQDLIKSPAVIYLVIAVIHYLILIVNVIVFMTNAFNFGMEQLLDSPTTDLILFIHWFVWVNYVSVLITELAWGFSFYDAYEFSYVDTNRTNWSCFCGVNILYDHFLSYHLYVCGSPWKKVVLY